MATMTKKELVERIADTEDVPKTLVTDIVNDVISSVKLALKDGDEVTLAGLGTFYVGERQKRSSRNRFTGEIQKGEIRRFPVFDDHTETNVSFSPMASAIWR